MLGSARILWKVLSVWTEWLTWVTDALGAWFAPGWCTKRTPAKTVIKEIIIILKHAVKIVIKNCHFFSESSNSTRQTWRAVPRKIHNQETSRSLILMTKLWEVRGESQSSQPIVVRNWQKCLQINKNSGILTKVKLTVFSSFLFVVASFLNKEFLLAHN